MKKYKRDIWKEKLLDEELQRKYGENWKLIKRTLKSTKV